MTADGSKALLSLPPEHWAIVPLTNTPAPGKEEKLKVAAIEIRIDPRAEWRQMYREVWRIERDFLYDPHAHGLDLAAAEKLYRPYLDGIAGREDLNDLLEDALGTELRAPGFPERLSD